MRIILVEIYHIVSNKALEQNSESITPHPRGETISVDRSDNDGGEKKNGKCC